MKDYRSGIFYDRGRMALRALSGREDVPLFKTPCSTMFAVEGEEEELFHEVWYRPLDLVSADVMKGLFSEFDLTVLRVIATFSPASVSTRLIAEGLVLLGAYDGEISKLRTKITNSLSKLNKRGLIVQTRFKREGYGVCPTKAISLTGIGSKVAKTQMSTRFFFSPEDSAARKAWEIKRDVAVTQSVFWFLKNTRVESFAVKKALVKNERNDRAIVRPSALINLGEGETAEVIALEVVRNAPEQLAGLSDKLERYQAYFSEVSVPHTLVVVCENEGLAAQLSREFTDHELIFTDDLSLFKQDVNDVFYTFDKKGRKCPCVISC